MPTKDRGQKADAKQVSRRQFLRRAGWSGVGVGALALGAPRGRAAAQAGTYPEWIPASTKTPKRGGTLTRASPWDPPMLDPRMTQSVGLYQFAGLTSNRLVRYAFADEASGPADMSLKGDLAESWSASPDYDLPGSGGVAVGSGAASFFAGFLRFAYMSWNGLTSGCSVASRATPAFATV